MAKEKWRQYANYSSFSKLSADLARGRVDMDMMISQYTHLYRVAQRRVTAVQKSSLPYGKGHKPAFIKPENIVTEGMLAREYTDVVKFLKRKNTTVAGRLKQFTKIQNSLRKQGFNITKKNFNKFVNFMDWFYASKYAAMFDSNEEIVNDVFNKVKRTSPSQWAKLFEEFIASGRYG